MDSQEQSQPRQHARGRILQLHVPLRQASPRKRMAIRLRKAYERAGVDVYLTAAWRA